MIRAAIMRRLARLERGFIAPLPATRLALVRILVAGFAASYLTLRWHDFIAVARLPASTFAPVGPCSLLAGPLSAAVVSALAAATIALALATALGIFHRVTAPLFALGVLWITSYRSSFGMLYHSENLLVLHAVVLAVTRAADALSVDAWRLRRRKVVLMPVHARYGWPVRLLCALTAATYFLAGIAKLRLSGPDWATGDALLLQLAHDQIRKAELGIAPSAIGLAALRQAWIFGPLAVATLALELGAPLVLLSRLARRTWAIAVVLFHWGIFAMMQIPFPYALSGVAVACFFPLDRLLPGSRATPPAAREPARSAAAA